MRQMALVVSLLLVGCVAQVTGPRVAVEEPAVYVPPPPPPVVSVYVEPPLSQPEPIAIGWAPPPMLVEAPPPPPFPEAVWVGGYWVWHGDWVWAHGHWVGAPRPNYVWVHPYYEHRDGVVIFITGHWSPPGVAFVPPPPGIHLTVEVAAAGVIAGPRPMGPNGCFVPPPPGSRVGIIVPAPIGTPPAVVTGAPPVVAVGMRVTTNVSNTTVVRNNTNITNVKNVTNITNVTIVAPPTATANHQAVNTTAPAQAHLAAAQNALVKAQAPEPTSAKPIPAFVHGQPPAALPPAQSVNAGPKQAHTPPPVATHPVAQNGERPPSPAVNARSNARPGSTPAPQVKAANVPGSNAGSSRPVAQPTMAKTDTASKGGAHNTDARGSMKAPGAPAAVASRGGAPEAAAARKGEPPRKGEHDKKSDNKDEKSTR